MTAMNELSAKAAATITLDGDFLRTWGRAQEYAVTRPAIAAYAAATADTRPERIGGDVAGPAYAFVPFTALLFSAVADLGGETLNGRLVHTHQQFRYERPIVAGDVLTVTAYLSGAWQGPFGTVLRMAATTVDADGGEVNELLATCLVAGASVINPIGAGDDADARPETTAKRPGARTAAVAVAADAASRYADASGDHNPIHLDPAVARAIGFSGVIVHGMCTLAMAVSAVEAAHPESSGVDSLAVEFTRPVLPRDRLSVRWHEDTDDAGLLTTSFDVTNRRQRTVMRGGSLVLRA